MLHQCISLDAIQNPSDNDADYDLIDDDDLSVQL